MLVNGPKYKEEKKLELLIKERMGNHGMSFILMSVIIALHLCNTEAFGAFRTLEDLPKGILRTEEEVRRFVRFLQILPMLNDKQEKQGSSIAHTTQRNKRVILTEEMMELLRPYIKQESPEQKNKGKHASNFLLSGRVGFFKVF